MKIAAFNVKRMGWTKVYKKAVWKRISKIVSEYSVVVLLEVMDETGKAMPLLLKHLNDYGDNRIHPYGMRCSESLRPEGHKEKFVYFYREDEVKIIRSYQYGGNARKPFTVLLNCPNTVVQELVLIPVHTKPSVRDTEEELIALHEVVEDVRKELKNDNIMILGDFNANGQYLSKRKKEKLRIFSAPYRWLIDDKKPYDRIVVYGERMLEAIVPNSAKAYNFEEELNLKQEDAQSVSNHYPVEVELEVKPEVGLEVDLVELMQELGLGQMALRKRDPVRP